MDARPGQCALEVGCAELLVAGSEGCVSLQFRARAEDTSYYLWGTRASGPRPTGGAICPKPACLAMLGDWQGTRPEEMVKLSRQRLALQNRGAWVRLPRSAISVASGYSWKNRACRVPGMRPAKLGEREIALPVLTYLRTVSAGTSAFTCKTIQKRGAQHEA